MTMMQGLPLTGVAMSATAKKKGEICLSSCLSHVKTMHQLLAALYDGLESEDLYEDEFEQDLGIDIGNTTKLAQHFGDRCYKLMKIMTEPTVGPVEFPVSQIINVLTRGLNLTYSDVLAVPSRTDLATLLPCLHQCCMDVLAQLILCCGRDLLAHSHVVIDLCLQTITSSDKMNSDPKFRTRSSVYQALTLWIKACGWSQYLTKHRKLVMQLIMADTQPDAEDKLSTKSDGGDGKDDSTIGGSKKNRKKKKKKRGESYMELEKQDDKKETEQIGADRIDNVVWAFSLSQLTVKNLPFSASQNLIDHLIKTATTIQRLAMFKPEPYRHVATRESLYTALASCLSCNLDYGGNRNDAVCHYQFTNSALELLSKACHEDEEKVVSVCTQALEAMKLVTNLNGPVIRKVPDFDDEVSEDVSQLIREKEQMSDCVDDLQYKLMTSALENSDQVRTIASLREQIANLQAEVSNAKSMQSISQKEASSNKDDDDSEDDDEMVEVSHNDNLGQGHQALSSKTSKRSRDQDGDDYSETNLKESLLSSSSINDKDNNGVANDSVVGKTKEEAKKLQSIPDGNAGKVAKRMKMDADDADEKNNDNGLEEMLLDFVDAPADS